jgi:hypothetical protein
VGKPEGNRLLRHGSRWQANIKWIVKEWGGKSCTGWV